MNKNVKKDLKDCHKELSDIGSIISSEAPFSKTTQYLTMYALIKACGTVENSYKSMIAYFFIKLKNEQARHYIETAVLKSNAAPTYDNICGLIGKFDKLWADEFKVKINGLPDGNKIIVSVKSLVDSRHEFAHGKTPSITFNSIVNYYGDAIKLLNALDEVLK